MALITQAIPPAAFEVIRDQIAIILAVEINNQYLNFNYIQDDINAVVYIERYTRPNSSELTSGPVVNVLLGTGDYDGQDPTQSNCTYMYFIDVYCKALATPTDGGDKLAMIKLQKMLRFCRAIIEDTRYKTLGFQPPFIMNRHFQKLIIQEPAETSADNLVRGRLVLSIKAPENVQIPPHDIIDGMDTQAFIGTTTDGFMYVMDNYLGEDQ